ncbi:hypothetical protein SORBI_3005G067850 [Sorghum bicolor]|uniref:Uncharacterized protein n=1 Tax=Sorghum bicolor TaxID=4558 RepID=A0A1Z5RHG3_SORBI|nr:hypothetical protein SORBI_3005G067850 [Sorghum bicolor]
MQLVHFDLNRELITIVHGISVLELIRCIATEESYHPRHLAAEPANPCVETKHQTQFGLGCIPKDQKPIVIEQCIFGEGCGMYIA